MGCCSMCQQHDNQLLMTCNIACGDVACNVNGGLTVKALVDVCSQSTFSSHLTIRCFTRRLLPGLKRELPLISSLNLAKTTSVLIVAAVAISTVVSGAD